MKRAVALAAAAFGIALGASASQAFAPAPIVFAADRAPTVSGEIYRVDPNGHRVNLSRSPYEDGYAVVSPNGRKVAFVRDLVSQARVFEVGAGGRHRVGVGPALPRPGQSGCGPTLAWQPGTDRLAVGVCTNRGGKLWIVRPGQTTLVSGAGLYPAWSPDGRVLAASTPSPSAGTVLHGYSSTGSPLWQIPTHTVWPPNWSSTNLLAVSNSTGLTIYDELGRVLSTTTGTILGGPSWSPNGQLIAVIADHWLTVRTPSGEGVLIHERMAGGHPLVWDGNSHVVIGGYGPYPYKAKKLNVYTGAFTPASYRWFHPLSRDGTLAILTPRSGAGYAIQVAPTAGGAPTTYTHIPVAYSDGPVPSALSLQFVGSTRSIVYASANPEPFSNLYTVAPGGTPHRITAVAPYAWQPRFSPDGSKLAYAWSPFTGLTCKGCATEIRVASAAGTGMQELTTPPFCTFDNSPAWSPDGTTLLYSESSCDNSGELFTVPAAGGAPHDLGLVGGDPAWGPSTIAYEGPGGIWTANPDGSNPTKVSSSGRKPAWSATGTLAYLVGASAVKVGSSTVQLPFARVASLAWSPDETSFVVVASKTKYGFEDVFAVKTDGTNPVRLTRYYDASSAAW